MSYMCSNTFYGHRSTTAAPTDIKDTETTFELAQLYFPLGVAEPTTIIHNITYV
jgi:hypothetical protein